MLQCVAVCCNITIFFHCDSNEYMTCVVYMYTCTSERVCMCVCVCECVYICVCMCGKERQCVRICLHMCVRVCVCECVCVCVQYVFFLMCVFEHFPPCVCVRLYAGV